MSERRILTRVRDRPGALERVIGLIRRRAFAVHRFSLAFAGDGVLEIVLRLDPSRTPPERVCAELAGLVDVLAVHDQLDGAPRRTRELLLVRGLADTADVSRAGGRLVPDGAGGNVVEITAGSDEVDDLVARLRAADPGLSFVRSGEVAIPDEMSLEPQTKGTTP